MHGLLLVLLATLPHDAAVTVDGVDVIERNSFFDCEGKLVFVQAIFWNFDEGPTAPIRFAARSPDWRSNDRHGWSRRRTAASPRSPACR